MDYLDYIGTPYDDAHDCYWLVRSVAEELRGVKLPEKPIGWRRFGRTIDWPTAVSTGDLIFMSSNELGMTDHVGIAISETDFLHASKIHGQVICEPVRKYSARIVSIGKFHDS